MSWAAGAAPKPHARSDGGIATDLLIEVVTQSVLVWFARQRGMKKWVCDGLETFLASRVVYSVLGAVGPRVVAAPVALPVENGGVLPLKQSTTRLKFAWFASVSGTNIPRRAGQNPQIN